MGYQDKARRQDAPTSPALLSVDRSGQPYNGRGQ
jgi:hypothetical protein